MSGLVPCNFCGNPVDTTSKSTMRLVRAWLPCGSISGAKSIDELFLYAHKICVEVKHQEIPMDKLF
jgi:hypothetical protein